MRERYLKFGEDMYARAIHEVACDFHDEDEEAEEVEAWLNGGANERFAFEEENEKG